MANGKTRANGTSGDAREATKEQQIIERRRKRGTGETADWGGCDSDKLRDAVSAVAKHGYALSLGYTRDGGAYTVFVVGMAGFSTEYIRPNEDIDLYLEALRMDFE